MKLYLARHGRTNYNELGLCNSDPSVDVHLTPQGVEQAKILAKKLQQVPLQCIYISELNRTAQTAALVNVYHNVPIVVDARLNDGRTGLEDKHYKDYEAALDATPDRWTARIGDGESITDIAQRAADFIADLCKQPYDTMLLVTSLWIIQAIVVTVRGLPIEQLDEIEAPQGEYLELSI